MCYCRRAINKGTSYLVLAFKGWPRRALKVSNLLLSVWGVLIILCSEDVVLQFGRLTGRGDLHRLSWISQYPLCPTSWFFNFPSQLESDSPSSRTILLLQREWSHLDIPGNLPLRHLQACGALSEGLSQFESDTNLSQWLCTDSGTDVTPAPHQVSSVHHRGGVFVKIAQWAAVTLTQ